MLALASSALVREEFTRAFDKTVPLRGGQTVSLEHRLGDIVIRTHAQPEVIIHADIHVSAADLNQAKEFANNIDIFVQPSTTGLFVRTKYPETGRSFFGTHNVSYYVRYDITVPETAPLQVRNSFGAVSVAGIKANTDVTTSHGQLEFRDGSGTQHLENSFAN